MTNSDKPEYGKQYSLTALAKTGKWDSSEVKTCVSCGKDFCGEYCMECGEELTYQ